MGLANELIKVFIFLGAEDSAVTNAFLFFTAAFSVALVFFASDAEGRLIFFIRDDFAAGVDEIGSVSSGATNASSGPVYSSGTTLEVALTVSSEAGISLAALVH